MNKKITIPAGTKVRVLDTPNVRKYNSNAIGYEFVTFAEGYYSGGTIICPSNKYGVNYKQDDLEIVKSNSIINNYQIY